MRILLMCLAVLLPSAALAQTVSRTELRNTNNVLLSSNATKLHTNGATVFNLTSRAGSATAIAYTLQPFVGGVGDWLRVNSTNGSILHRIDSNGAWRIGFDAFFNNGVDVSGAFTGVEGTFSGAFVANDTATFNSSITANNLASNASPVSFAGFLADGTLVETEAPEVGTLPQTLNNLNIGATQTQTNQSGLAKDAAIQFMNAASTALITIPHNSTALDFPQGFTAPSAVIDGTDLDPWVDFLTIADPNADRILFWDDSDGLFKYLTLGTGLSISGTTINATGTGTPDGDSGAIQFNEGDTFAGTNDFIWNRTNKTLVVRNQDLTGSKYIYFAGSSLTAPDFSIQAGTNEFILQPDFGSSGTYFRANKSEKWISIGTTANNLGTNWGNWYFPSNVTFGAGMSVTGDGSDAGYTEWYAMDGNSYVALGAGTNTVGTNILRLDIGLGGLTKDQYLLVHSRTVFGTTNFIVLTNAPLSFQPTNTVLTFLGNVDTNGIIQRKITNYAHATSIAINAGTDVSAFVTNYTTANVSVLLTNAVVGTSGSFTTKSDSSARTFSFFSDKLITMLSTNETLNSTQVVTTAGKKLKVNWHVEQSTNGTAEIALWAKSQP